MAQTAPPKPAKPPKQQRPPKKSPLAAAAAPRTAAQAAQAELDPVIASITAAANQRAAASEAAIKGLTDSYAHSISGIDYGAPYAGAESGQAAVDAALEQSLAGHGSDLAAGLATRLAPLAGTSGAPVVADTGQGLAAQGAGAGTARVASGSAALGNLIADAAASREYGTKMPGIADLSGLQGLKQAEGNAQSEIAQGTTAVESKLPDIIQQIKADRLAARNAKTEAAYRGAELALARDKAAAQVAQGNARLGIEQQNANTSAFRAQNSAAHDAELERMARLNYGISYQKLQDAEVKAQRARARGGLTPSQLDTVHSEAQDFTKGLFEGIPRHVTYPNSTNGLTAPRIDSWKQAPVKYQKTIKLLMQRYPALGPQAAINIANSFYRPGEGGRPTAAQPELSEILGPPGGVAPPASPFGVPGGSHIAQIKDPRERQAAATIVGQAQQFIGTPYVWGGESPKGFDCSGFAQYLYRSAGVNIPRTTYTQWSAPNAHAVPPGQLMPGDLVFFKGSDSVGGLPGHVGIYIGGGKMIDAPHTGATVRVESIEGFPGYMGARRYR